MAIYKTAILESARPYLRLAGEAASGARVKSLRSSVLSNDILRAKVKSRMVLDGGSLNSRRTEEAIVVAG